MRYRPGVGNEEKAVRAPARRRRGGAVVEFAVAAPILFAVILGIIEVGRGLMALHLLTNAARVGCRAGVVESVSTDTIKSAVTSALKTQGITGATPTVLVNESSSTDASSAVAGDEITVKVSVPVSSITWVPVPNFLSGTITAQYTLRRE